MDFTIDVFKKLDKDWALLCMVYDTMLCLQQKPLSLHHKK